MNNRLNWIKNRIRLGWMILAAGVIVGVTGILLEIFAVSPPFRPSMITGLGILFAGIGLGIVVRYRSALKGDEAAKRLTVEEWDERTIQIRTRAGYRGFWVSIVLVYTGLMWVSFGANGTVPELRGDTLWWFLATCVIIPFGVYIGSYILDQRNS